MVRLLVTMAFVLSGLVVAIPSVLATEPVEAWCTANPTVCVGSRTLNSTGTWTFLPGCLGGTGCYWETDQPAGPWTDFLGLIDNSSGTDRKIIWTNSGVTPVNVSSGITGINAVRLRNTTVVETAVPARPNPTTGAVGARWYQRFNTGYETNGDNGGACFNDKKIQFSGAETGYLTTQAFGYIAGGTTGAVLTPILDTHTVVGTGHWIKLEMYVDDVTTINRHIDSYATDISTGVQSSAVELCSDQPACTAPATVVMQPLHWFREGSCAGTSDIMYVAYSSRAAGSRTRIPGATEVEGGTPEPPAPPADVTVTSRSQSRGIFVTRLRILVPFIIIILAVVGTVRSRRA